MKIIFGFITLLGGLGLIAATVFGKGVPILMGILIFIIGAVLVYGGGKILGKEFDL